MGARVRRGPVARAPRPATPERAWPRTGRHRARCARRSRSPPRRAARRRPEPVGRLRRRGRPTASPASRAPPQPRRRPHAEVVAPRGGRRRGPRAPPLYVTLEPCSHHGRTAAVRRRPRSTPASPGSWSASSDPDPQVAGDGHRRACAAAGIEVEVGVAAAEVDRPARARTSCTAAPAGPTCVLKLAATPRRPHRRARRHVASGSPARRPAPTPTACGPRATRSLVGAGTVRADDPTPHRARCPTASCRRVDTAPRRARPRARAAPRSTRALELDGDLGEVLDELGGRGVLQVLVEGGAIGRRATSTRAGLVDRYVLYLAPALFGGDDARGAVRRAGRADASPTSGAGRIVVGRPGSATTSASTCDAAPPIARTSSLMFTGIVEELGTVASPRRRPRCASAPRPCSTTSSSGDSIAVNGCCLTVVELGRRAGGRPTSSTRRSTARTSATCAPGDPVNLERPVRLADRLGGHLVQGHVDAVGEIVEPAPDLRVRMPRRPAALRRREGLDHRRRRQPHRRRRRSTTASPSPSSRTPPRSPPSATRARATP